MVLLYSLTIWTDARAVRPYKLTARYGNNGFNPKNDEETRGSL